MKRTSLLFVLLLGISFNVFAHDLGDGAHISTIFTESPNSPENYTINWTLEITVQELLGEYPEYDIDENGRLTPIEYGAINAREIAEYVQNALQVTGDEKPCVLEIKSYNIVTHKRADFIQFPLSVNCDSSKRSLGITYNLFFQENPYHQGTWTLVLDNQPSIFYFWEDERVRTFSIREYSSVEIANNFFLKGMHHIAIGFDHILFLMSLLLTAVLVRNGDRWSGADQISTAIWSMVKIVTAFTVAHTVTLTLAVLDLVPMPPSAIVEGIIAASVFLMALNNVLYFAKRVYLVTFLFGLIHGFGFASVLLDYSLPPLQLSLSLVSFNIGVEVGQLLIAAVIFGCLVRFRHHRGYIDRFMPIVSSLIMLMALFWMYERLLVPIV